MFNQRNLAAVEQVAEGVYRLKIVFVNAYFVDTPENELGSWVLVDTGLPKMESKIMRVADSIYGRSRKPSAIVLTHGHVDHAGGALYLAERWNVPIYAHQLEMPYLTGQSDYPPQDPTVGGALGFLSRFMTVKGFDFDDRVRELPEGNISVMKGWQAIHTPGHAPGQISLFRASDRTLLAGDAFATMNQDSWSGMITEKREFHRTPAPFTIDWQAALNSIETLARLEPNAVGAGHGKAITGANTAEQLKDFARNFIAPSSGRYVPEPAITDKRGVVAIPPPVPDPLWRVAVGVAVVGATGIAVAALAERRNRRRKR